MPLRRPHPRQGSPWAGHDLAATAHVPDPRRRMASCCPAPPFPPVPVPAGRRSSHVSAVLRDTESLRLLRWLAEIDPALYSGQRRRADAESGHIRPFPVTRGLTPSNRVGLPHTEEAAVSGYAALCLPSAEPDHLVGHLILKSYIRKTSLSWSPVTESNRRPSPYHASRHRLAESRYSDYCRSEGHRCLGRSCWVSCWVRGYLEPLSLD